MREWVSINGRVMPADQAVISAFDSGFLQGIGLFETMRAYAGRVFRAAQHLDRLAASARKLGWSQIPPVDEIEDAITQVVNSTEQTDARVRVTVTTGSLRAVDGDSDSATPQLTIVASASSGGVYPAELYKRGASIVVSEYRQNPLDPTTGHKTTSYFARLASLREAHARGALESLWLTIDNEVAECAISNIFLIKDGVLLTPPVDLPVLPGITRAAVLELCEPLGLETRQEPLEIEDVLSADELFLTNSMMEIMPVVMIDRQPIANGKPGDVTQRMHTAYRTLVQQECGDAAI